MELTGLWNHLPIKYLLAKDDQDWKRAGCEHKRLVNNTDMRNPLNSSVLCLDCGEERTYSPLRAMAAEVDRLAELPYRRGVV